MTKFPRYGICQSLYSDTYFLVIGITYRLRTNFGRLKYGARNKSEYNDIELGVAIRGHTYQALGLELCGRCVGRFYQSKVNAEVGNTVLSLFFVFQPIIYTRGSKCSEKEIVNAMSKIVGDELILDLEENEYATFDIDEIENIDGIRKNVSFLDLPATDDDDKLCTARVYLDYRDLNRCPMVRLDDTYYPSLKRLADTAAKKRLVNTLFDVDGRWEELPTGLNTTAVCWEDYSTVVPRVTSLSLKHAGNTFCSTMIIFVAILLF